MKAQPTEKPAAERKPSLPAEPTFNVRNLGSVRTGSFIQKPLTLFCGPNNTGKTWTMYSLYYWRQLLKQITKDQNLLARMVETIRKRRRQKLPQPDRIQPHCVKNSLRAIQHISGKIKRRPI